MSRGGFAALLYVGAVQAQTHDRHFAETTSAVLTLAQVQHLAIEEQPQLAAQAAQVRAFDARAISASQLPDPQLMAGVQDLPVNRQDAYSFRRDDFTMLTVGVTQEFTRTSKLELRGEKQRLMARGAQDQLQELQRRIQREAGLAYLELYLPEQAEGLISAMLLEAERSQKAAEIAYRAGKNEQADVLAADLSLSLLRDKQAEYAQMSEHARRLLARWIGDSADAHADLKPPTFAEPPSLSAITAALPGHPALRGFANNRDVAQNEIALSKQAYKPDWRMELGYGHRVDYADLVTLKVGIDLPVFTRNRQDSDADAARADAEQADAQHDDALREFTAQASLAHHDWQRLSERVNNFDNIVLPQAHARVEAAMASYSAGRGTLTALLDARRSLLDVQLQRLTLAVDALRNRLALEYFIGDAS
jgi:outer membrane protein TolC